VLGQPRLHPDGRREAGPGRSVRGCHRTVGESSARMSGHLRSRRLRSGPDCLAPQQSRSLWVAAAARRRAHQVGDAVTIGPRNCVVGRRKLRCSARSGAASRTDLHAHLAERPVSSWLPPSPTYRHSRGEYPESVARRRGTSAGPACHRPTSTENTCASSSGCTGHAG
jgi:hypothetical protein